MTDANKEIEELLSGLGVRVVYASPSECGELPAVSYYMLSEKGGFSCDNEESATDIKMQIDIWTARGKTCAEIASRVTELLHGGGFCRELAMDVPKSSDGVCHRTMRFAKRYVL